MNTHPGLGSGVDGAGRRSSNGCFVALVTAVGAAGLVSALFLDWWKSGSVRVGAFDDGLHPVVAVAIGLGVIAALDAVLGALVAPGGRGRAAWRFAWSVASLAVVAAVALQDWRGATRGTGMFVALGGAGIVVMGCALQLRRGAVTAITSVSVAVDSATSPVPAHYAAPLAGSAQYGAPFAGSTPYVAPVSAPVAAAAAAPAQSFYFFVDAPVAMLDEATLSQTVTILQPGSWYVARYQHEGWLAVDDGAGGRGWVPATSVRRAG